MSNPIYPIAGVRVGAASAGITASKRLDIVVIALDVGTTTAVVFTRNAFCAAPVQVAKSHLQQCAPRYLLVNAGNANAGTGRVGIEHSELCCASLASLVGCSPTEVLPFSTGVIGEPLPVDKIIAHLPDAVTDLQSDGWSRAATGIMTTDTCPKTSSQQILLGDQTVTITGIAKGAGMIKPNMATMLAYIATDAAISQAVLNDMLRHAVDQSFNRITVDGDTSTNDACVLVATGQTDNRLVDSTEHEFFVPLQQAITTICTQLAQAIIRDGEGATKFVTIDVQGGRNEQECLQVAYTIAESPLVKTALFAGDPNWGRILAAVGRAGIDDLDVSHIDIMLNNVLIVQRGGRAASYSEQQGIAAMAPTDITITVQLQRGAYQAAVNTCDLSYDYVRINAEYRT